MAGDPVGNSANYATVGKHLVALTWDSALCKDSGVLRGSRNCNRCDKIDQQIGTLMRE